MKKSLIVTLALVFVLGIAGTAFAAANPFVDVPAKHWAYDAVSKLAQAGVVDGYGDGTFRGDKTITRYEMAQIVAKAMTRSDKQNAETKALVDKLAVEFSAELNNLGVRVAKLEANQSTVKMTGDARLRWVDDKTGNTKFGERFRLNMTADVNENTSLYGRIQAMNHNEMGTYGGNNDRLNLVDAAFTTKDAFNSGATVTAGRFSQNIGQTTYWMGTTGGVDGAKVALGNKVKVSLGFANFAPYKGIAAGTVQTDPAAPVAGIGDALFGEVSYNTSKATNISASYFNEKSGALSAYDYRALGFTTKLTDKLALTADYGKNFKPVNKAVFSVTRLSYGAANAKVQGSWGVLAEYKKIEANANDADYTGSWLNAVSISDVKGWDVIASTTLAKNIVFDAIYAFSQKKASDNTTKNDYFRLQVNYNF